MSKRAILCVDDEMIILLSMVQNLKKAFGNDFLYEQALNVEAALAAIEELRQEDIQVILIITDWLMPGIKGDEFLETVYKRYPDIKAIMITGYMDEQRIQHIRKLDSVLSVLKKPWKNDELIKIIKSYVHVI